MPVGMRIPHPQRPRPHPSCLFDSLGNFAASGEPMLSRHARATDTRWLGSNSRRQRTPRAEATPRLQLEPLRLRWC